MVSLPISPKYKGSVHKSAEATDSGMRKPFFANGQRLVLIAERPYRGQYQLWITNVCRQTTEGTVHLCDGVTATATLHKMEKADIVSAKSDKQTAVKCPML